MTPTAQTRNSLSASAVPVLMYHSIAEADREVPVGQSLAYSTRTSEFRSQLQFLKSTGFTVIDLERLSRGEAPARAVVLTFDDGCMTDYSTSLACLGECGYTATYFLSTANIGTPGYMTWSQVREMQKAGMQFGSHSHEHIPLTPLSADEVREQLKTSKLTIEDQTGVGIKTMSAPFGFLNRRVSEIARELGYEIICNSVPKMAQPGQNSVPRIAVMRSTTIDRFERILTGDWRSYVPAIVKATLFYVPRHLLLRLRPTAPGVRTLKRPA